MRLVASLLTTPTSTIFRAVSGLWCVLPLLSPPLHHSCLSFLVDSSIFNSAEFQQIQLYPLRLATQASLALLSCSYWPFILRFWRPWIGDILGLKVCVPLEVVLIDSCRSNDPVPPFKPPASSGVVFLPAGTLPPGLVTDILGYLQNEIVRFLHFWMRLIISFPTTPTSTIFHARVFGHLVRTSSVVTSSTSLLSVFSSGWLHLQLSREHPKVSPHSLSVATQGYGIPAFPP